MDYEHDPEDVASCSSGDLLDGPTIAALLEELPNRGLDEEMAECKKAFEQQLLEVWSTIRPESVSRPINLVFSKDSTRRQQQGLLRQFEGSVSAQLTIVLRDWLTGDLQNAFEYSKHNSNSQPLEDCTGCREVLRFTTEAASGARALLKLSDASATDDSHLESIFFSYIEHLEIACLNLDEARIRAHPDQQSTPNSRAQFLAMVQAPTQLHDNVALPLVATVGSNEATGEAFARATLALLATYRRASLQEVIEKRRAGNTGLVSYTRASLANLLRREEASSSAGNSVADGAWNLLGNFAWSNPDPAKYQQAREYLTEYYQELNPAQDDDEELSSSLRW